MPLLPLDQALLLTSSSGRMQGGCDGAAQPQPDPVAGAVWVLCGQAAPARCSALPCSVRWEGHCSGSPSTAGQGHEDGRLRAAGEREGVRGVFLCL